MKNNGCSLLLYNLAQKQRSTMVLQWFAFVGWLTCEAGLESTDYTLCFVAHGIMLLL